MQVSHDSAWDDFLEEFINIFSVDDLLKYKVFVCGSYNEKNLKLLQVIQNTINQMENHVAYIEKEFRRTHIENLIFKFDLIAKFSDDIIMVIEHDKGGHIIEMGIILSFEEFYKKAKVFVLTGADITEVLKRGGLLTPFFREGKNLFYFEDPEILPSHIEILYSKPKVEFE